ncbi:M81 family metallopeptidase [Bosea sp. ANAM02]|uniref:M81 family metallopeptidase n=1 Tax=Bosea sp. ANAM02 TaxID=2020412 RepID=UPI00140F2444|nr:M81 family metallopeptidase [Bosea sp. ANAM02]BCB17801.1 microcystinase C [Bosea sp. ANAM02]
MPRLAVARFSHEGNSFSPVITGLNEFRREWYQGQEAEAVYRGTTTEGGGAVAFLDAHPEWRGTFLRMAGATPAGPVTREAYDAILDEIVADLIQGEWDAVFLSLHGAMVVEGMDLADYEIVRRVREAIGPEIPFGVSFDLHANLDPRIADLVTFAAGFKEHPHVDMKETAELVLDVLDRTVKGEVHPVGHIAKLDAILPSINMRTAEGPMAELEAFARGLEFDPRILDASPFGGFSYGDTIVAGAGALVYADGDKELAKRAAERIVEETRRRLGRFYISLPDAATGIAQALKLGRESQPVAVIDSGDNPLSGGIGDTPEMLRALLEAAPQVSTVLAFFADPALVERCIAAGEGAAISGTLGGRISAEFGPPVPFSGTVLRLTDGHYVNSGPMMRGLPMTLGPTAVIGIGQVRVIVTTACGSAHDPAFYALHGVDFIEVALLCVKAKNHFRAAFSAICPAMIDIDAPGPAALDINRFPFRLAPSTLYPLHIREAS